VPSYTRNDRWALCQSGGIVFEYEHRRYTIDVIAINVNAVGGRKHAMIVDAPLLTYGEDSCKTPPCRPMLHPMHLSSTHRPLRSNNTVHQEKSRESFQSMSHSIDDVYFIQFTTYGF
jgi:hypothetical protein